VKSSSRPTRPKHAGINNSHPSTTHDGRLVSFLHRFGSGRNRHAHLHELDRGQDQPRQPAQRTHHDLSPPRKTLLGQSHVGKRSRHAE
jgi:hypothetical protein